MALAISSSLGVVELLEKQICERKRKFETFFQKVANS